MCRSYEKITGPDTDVSKSLDLSFGCKLILAYLNVFGVRCLCQLSVSL